MAKLEILYGQFFLATLGLQICSSAVICPPCGPGEFCYAFFGMCLLCADYCRDGDVCPKECSHNKLSTILPTPAPNQTSFHPVAFSPSTETPDIVVTSTDKLPLQSDGGGSNTFLPEEYLELSLELLLGLLFVLILFAICGWFCLKRSQTLQMFIRCCRKNRDSRTGEDIELTVVVQGVPERRTMNRQCSSERMTTLTNDTVQVADEVGANVVNQPGPSVLNSSRSKIRATDTRPTSHERLTPTPVDVVHPYQSARINPEHERLLGAVPSNNQSGNQKTPETLRKITDGTLEGHLCVPGASPFIPAPFEHEDFQWNRDSDGD